jgi:hypothetical protein
MRTLLTLIFLALAICTANAQGANAIAVTTCGNQTYPVGQFSPLTMDATGKLCDNVNLGTTSISTKSGQYVSAGNGQYALSVSTATSLTVPTGATVAQICVESATVRYRDDGSAPTASSGVPVLAGSCFQYAGPLASIQFIAAAGSPTIDVAFYK